jgi:chromosome segregation ATPase
MSFSDMMSSGRGPGVIGMVMALIVLLGFGLLFMYASDEGSMGGHQSIESLIAHQAKEIEGYNASIAHGRKTLELAPGRTATSKELTRLKRENQAAVGTIANLTKAVEAGKADIAQRTANFEAYKNEYRAFVRGKAKGETMDQLVTLSGAVYKNVNIREVSAIGIQIRHDEGQKRIAFEELPEAMKDHFQFDPKQKEEAVNIEIAARGDHDAAVAAANEIAEQQMDAQRAQDAQEAKARLRAEIAAKEAQISSLKSEIEGLQRDRERAEAVAAAARASGKVHINKSGNIGGNIRSKESKLAGLQSEVAQMKSGL